jgi:hypothetical protein
METNRVLLPIYERYVNVFGVEKKETPEDFSFMHNDSQEYEMFRKALDEIPGSRDYLKNYVYKENSFSDPIGSQLMTKAGEHHSGSSVRALAWTYKQILNDWDGWVLTKKIYYSKKLYEKRQLSREDTWEYDRAVCKKNSHSSVYRGHSKNLQELDDAIQVAIENLRTKFSLIYTNAEICQLMDDLINEFEINSRKEMYERDKREFDDKIELLEHHYEHPTRWEDYGKGMLKSSLFGSIYGITEPMYAVMETRHPGYRQHIRYLMNPHHARCACSGCHRKRVADGTDKEYAKWVTDEANKIFEPRESSPKLTYRRIDNGIIVDNVFAKYVCYHNLPYHMCMNCHSEKN